MAPGFRFDRFDLRPSHRTDEGFLICEAAVAKPGILPYRMDDGSIRKEYVPKKTLRRRSDLGTLGLKPVTDRHPDQPLNPKNARDEQVGSVGNEVEFREANGLVAVKMCLHDEEAIDAAESGERDQTSPGYKVKTDEKPGTYKGERYDAVQVARRYNHFALCEQARGGPDIGVRVDSLAQQMSGFRNDEAGGDWSVGMMDVRGDATHNWMLQDLVSFALKLVTTGDTDREDVIEQIADDTGEDKSDVLHMTRGEFEITDDVLAALAELSGVDRELFNRAKVLGEAQQDARDDGTTVIYKDDEGDRRHDAQVNNPGDLPIASVDRDWDKQRALDSLYSYYDVDPESDAAPDEWHDNWLYVEQDADDAFTEGHSYLVVEVIDGERHIVPAALEAAQNFLRGNSGLPSDQNKKVRRVVTEQWHRVANKYGDEWIDPEPVWNREDSEGGDVNTFQQFLRTHIDSLLDDNPEMTEPDVVQDIASNVDGVDQSTVWGYLTGRRDAAVELELLQQIAEVLPVDMSAKEIAKSLGLEVATPEGENEDDEGGDDSQPNGDETMDPLQKVIEALEKRLDSLAEHFDEEEVELPDELKQMREEIDELKNQREKVNEQLEQRKRQIQGMMESLDLDVAPGAPGDDETSGGEGGDGPSRTNDEDGDDEDNRGDSRFDSEEEMLNWYNERRELEKYADRFNVDGVEDLSNAELKRKIVAEAHGDETDAWRDDSVVEGAFRVLKKKLDSRDESYEQLSESANKRRDANHGADELEQQEQEADEEYLDFLVNGGDDE
ncbi:MAG: DUF2213 domain-containing protein [Bradymonadaceae bacterium]